MYSRYSSLVYNLSILLLIGEEEKVWDTVSEDDNHFTLKNNITLSKITFISRLIYKKDYVRGFLD